ncbi:hypothetical protein EDB87DRAFT_1833273 [Lactarius vividus]|nr:hypothetical protein EDB87DRAFT_1833273 [Lactarius vividus]
MSPTSLEGVNKTEASIGTGAGDHQYPPQLVSTQEVPNFVDSSGPLFSMYLEMAGEEDKKMAEDWKADADGILIFTGLFSAAVASLISMSIQDIRPNPQDTSNFYLANIYQAIADSDPNRPNISLPSSPPTFSPPNYAVWVNSLWFMSLMISLTCALLATLLQQWARRYLKVTQPRYSPHRRARIRAFFFEGVDRYLLPWVVDVLPMLLHVSLFLFFAGLVVFLCNVNLTIFKLVLSWVGICTTVYGCITVMPLFRHNSPYYTPLTSLVWPIIIGTLYIIFRALRYFIWSVSVRRLKDAFHEMLLQGLQRMAEGTALQFPSGSDARAFMWTFDTLDEDHELERFFSGLPGFRSSKVVDDPLPGLTWEQKGKFCQVVIGLFDRTFSSNLLSESVKGRRAIICAKALDPATFPVHCRQIVGRILVDDQCRGLQAAEFGHTVRDWADSRNQSNASVARAIRTGIVARVRQHDDSWFFLASNELSVPESVLRSHATRGDSLSLAILIHATRQQLSHYSRLWWPKYEFSQVLEAASRFNIRDTSPELQHEFCALWNQIVLTAKDSSGVNADDDLTVAWYILRPIHNVYLALHGDTTQTRLSATTGSDRDATMWKPSSYSLCNIFDHHPDSTPHIRCNASTSITFANAVLHHDAASVPAPLPSLPDVPSSSTPTPLRIDRNADATRDVDTSARTIPPTTPEISTSRTSVPLISSVSPQNNADLTSSDAPDFSLSPIPDNTFSSESYSSIPATITPGISPGQTFAPDLGATIEDKGTPNIKYTDTGNHPSVNHAIHVNTASQDLPIRSTSLPSVTGGAIAGPLPCFSDGVEHTGDQTVHASHG